MPFVGNVISGDPVLRGALQHPKKALLNVGSRETTISTSYDGTLLDHLDETPQLPYCSDLASI